MQERGPLLSEYMRTHKACLRNGVYYRIGNRTDGQNCFDDCILGLIGEERVIEAYLQKVTAPDA